MREDNDDGDVGAHQRFLTDPATHKTILSLVSLYTTALHPDDESLDDVEVPELSRNNRVLLTNGIFELMQDLIGAPAADDEEEFGDEDDEVASITQIGVEVAKDKRMSRYYKAFMGQMASLVDPWHKDKRKFVEMWGAMGNDLASQSPAREPKEPLRLLTAPADQKEIATVIGGASALPSKVARAITDMGFLPLEDAPDGDAAWVINGSKEGKAGGQVILVRRDDDSYIVMYSEVTRYQPYGRVIKRHLLDDNTPPEKIMRIITYLYDMMAQE